MTTFISLITLTQQGEENIRHSVERADEFRELAEKQGATVKDVFWTLGGYDGVLILEAPDEETVASVIIGRRAGKARSLTR